VLKHFDEVLAHRRAVAQWTLRGNRFRFYFHLLPPLSDGFAITQLEALAYALQNAIRDCIANPNRLQQFAPASRLPDEFTIDALGQRLQELGSAL